MASLTRTVEGTAFLWALRDSPTFLSELLGLGAIAAAVTILAALPLAARLRRRRRAVAGLHRSTAGVVLAADLILIMIPLMVIILVLLQTLWLMRETVIVHYAAFNAARSARVHLCPPLPESTVVLMMQTMRKAGCTNDTGKAEFAARMSLISASPPWGIPCTGRCDVPERAIRAIAGNAGARPQADAVVDQARYAFDRDNVTLTVGFDPAYPGAFASRSPAVPVRARLGFRHYVIYGLGPMFGTRRADGYYYRASEAEVTVL